jgi:hypothetical protein
MLDIWANLALLIGLAIMGGFVYFVLLVMGKIFFEDMIGGSIKKVKRKIEQKDDQYIY